MAILKNLIVNGVTRVIGDLTASKIIKQGGISSLFLKADGSVDSISYYHSGNKPSLSDLGAAAANHTHSYLPLSGGILTGKVNFATLRMLQWINNDNYNNNTGCSWYGIGLYQGSDSYTWLNISNYYGINITTKGDSYLQHNGNIIYTSANLPAYPTSLPANGGNADTAKTLCPTNHGYHIAVNNSTWKSVNILSTSYTKELGDYTDLLVPGENSNTASFRLIRNGNILIGTSKDDGYKLSVNGSINATELYDGGTRVSLNGHTHSYLPLLGGTLINHDMHSTLSLNATNGSADAWNKAGNTMLRFVSNNNAMVFSIGSPNNERTGFIQVGHVDTNYYAHITSALHLNKLGGAVYINNNIAWHAGNDGSGSGLDADLLDGNHASAFATANHTHSYLSLEGGTITGTLTISRDSAAIHYNNSSGVSQGWLGFSAADTPAVWMADGSTIYNIIHSGNIGSQSVNYATSSGSANIATIAGSLGDNDTINMYAQYSDEINFGGRNSSPTIYFGYRATDSRPIPTEFIFGSSTGTANLKASKFIKTGSSDLYVLLGAGGHKAISDFAISGHTHDYIPLSGSTNISGNLRFSHEYTFQGYTPRKKRNGGGWNYKPFSIIDYSGSNFAHFGVYGENNDLKYIYIGSNDYDSNDNLRIYPNGNINANNFYANSDIRYKNIIECYYSISDKIAQLPIIKYKWTDRDDDSIRIGSSALSVMSIIPELVSYDNNTDFYSLDYATLGAVAGISACKEVEILKLKIKELELEIIILKSKYNG